MLSESKKDGALELVCGPVLAFSWRPYLLSNLNSLHSEGHKSVVVRMYYEEINIYQIAFREGEKFSKKKKKKMTTTSITTKLCY